MHGFAVGRLLIVHYAPPNGQPAGVVAFDNAVVAMVIEVIDGTVDDVGDCFDAVMGMAGKDAEQPSLPSAEGWDRLG